MSLNMKKEISKELRNLRQQSRMVDDKLAQCQREDKREIRRLEKRIFQVKKGAIRALLVADRAWTRIDKRIAILQGRLS